MPEAKTQESAVKTPPTILLIARHGNTFGPGDVVTRVGGRTDLPLVESGLQQGMTLGQYFKQHKLNPAVVFTSQLLRTKQTAEKISEGLGREIPMQALSIFDEIDYGPDENRPESEVVERLGAEALKKWDESGVVPQGWRVNPEAIRQAWLEFAERMRRDYAGQTVLVVTSNGIARFSPVLLRDLSEFKKSHGLKIATGSFCRFEIEAGEGSSHWRCTGWNVRPSA